MTTLHEVWIAYGEEWSERGGAFVVAADATARAEQIRVICEHAGLDHIEVSTVPVESEELASDPGARVRQALDALQSGDYSGDLTIEVESWARQILDPEEGDVPGGWEADEIAIAKALAEPLGITPSGPEDAPGDAE